MIRFGEFGKQPFHFVLLEWHIHFDGGMAGNRRCNTRANRLHVQALFFARKLLQQFGEQMLDLAASIPAGETLTAIEREPNSSASKPFAAILRQFH